MFIKFIQDYFYYVFLAMILINFMMGHFMSTGDFKARVEVDGDDEEIPDIPDVEIEVDDDDESDDDAFLDDEDEDDDLSNVIGGVDGEEEV